jgi:hypothetical protein
MVSKKIWMLQKSQNNEYCYCRADKKVHFDLLPDNLTGWLTVCVTCVWVGVDNAWEQEKTQSYEKD